MMTSMGPSFAGHPAGMHQHPGVPGHPMAPGMPHNQGQQGAPGGGMPQQMHMAASGPGGQVNPAALMGGMPPGAGGPNAHALQHLNPAQNAMFQQGQFGNFAANNPMLQQQRFLQQQNARQHMLAQQAFQQANMQVGVNGMPMGVPMNPAQLQAMRQARMQQQPHAGNPQAQAILAQQIALQQQQQVAQNQQMQQGNQPGHPMQMNPQQLHNLQQAQLAASMQAQQQGQQPQGQPPQQPQPQGQQGQPQPQPQQTPQQQSAQPANPQSGGHPTPSQTPNPQASQQPQPPQPQNQPQGPPQPGQPHPQQGQPPQPQQISQAQQNALAQAMVAQQAAQQAAHAQAQQRREGMKGHCLLKLMQFSEHLSGFQAGMRGKDDLTYWNSFVQQFFSPKGVFRHSVHIVDAEDQADKQYEITYPALPRYFHTHFDSGVKTMQLIMEKGTTDRPLPGDGHWIENTKSSLVYWFDSGSHLVATGTVRAHFDSEQKIELFEFITTSHEEYIPRKAAIEAAKPAHNWIKEWHAVNTQDPTKSSPEMSKKGKAKQMKSPQFAPPEALVDLPDSMIKKSMGITEPVFQFLEIAEVMGQMNPLFGFYVSHPGLGPYAALEQYVMQVSHQPQGPNGQPMQQPGQRTPSFSNFPVPVPQMGQVGASPAHSHMQIPGSPHVMGSPAPGHMQAPGMQMQASQQGTSSSGPSANTSPQSNKRRRPSGVKVEEDSVPTPGGQVNGVGKGKPPTPRITKRVKGNQAQA